MDRILQMADLDKILKQMKAVPKYSELSFADIDKALVSKLMIRYRLLTIVYHQLETLGVTEIPTPADILAMKPVKAYGEVCATNSIVAAAFASAVEERDRGYQSVIDILRLHKLSKPIDFGAIDDPTAHEFLSRIPVVGEMRTYREVKLPNEARVYFCINRYMVMVNKGTGSKDEDQNYFLTIIDLGSMLQNYLNGNESYVLNHPTIIARLEKIPFTGKPRHVNTKVMLWDMIREPARYYWFVRGSNIRRPNYTFEIVFGRNKETRYAYLSNEVWEFYSRAFGIVIEPPTKLRKSA